MIRVCLGNLDSLLHVGVGFTDRAISFLLGNALLRVVDRFCGGFLTEGGNVARLVADIGDVDVDES